MYLTACNAFITRELSSEDHLDHCERQTESLLQKNTEVYILLLFIHSKILNHQRLDYGFCEIEILKPLDILMKETSRTIVFIDLHTLYMKALLFILTHNLLWLW